MRKTQLLEMANILYGFDYLFS